MYFITWKKSLLEKSHILQSHAHDINVKPLYCHEVNFQKHHLPFQLTAFNCEIIVANLEHIYNTFLPFYRWSLPSQGFEADFLENVKASNLSPRARFAYSPAEWSTNIVGLVSSLVVNSNYNSHAGAVGCSILNISQCLADLERSITPQHEHSASVVRPYAEKLLAGNEEEDDNIFFEYCSHIVDGYTWSKEEFETNRHGLMLQCLFDQKKASGHGDYDVPIARPTKSCRPDWVLKFRGAPLAYGEGKSSPQGDTVEGLSYTTVCAAHILNYMPMSPAIVMHSTNARFRFQAIRLDVEEDAFQVLQRNGMRYDLLDPTPDSLAIDAGHFTSPPIMYHFERVSKSVVFLKELAPHFEYGIHSVQEEAAATQQAKYVAENLGRRKHVRVEDSPARSYIEDDVYEDPYSDDGQTCLVLKVFDNTRLTHRWMQLPGKLRQYILALFEAIDVTTALLMEQDPDGAAVAYSRALSMGRFVKPVKFSNMKDVLPFDRAQEICEQDFWYSEIRKWRDEDVSGHSVHWAKAVEEAKERFEEPLPEIEKFAGVTPAKVMATPIGGDYRHTIMAPSAHKVASVKVKKEDFATPVKRVLNFAQFQQQAAAATPLLDVKTATPQVLHSLPEQESMQPQKLDF